MFGVIEYAALIIEAILVVVAITAVTKAEKARPTHTINPATDQDVVVE